MSTGHNEFDAAIFLDITPDSVWRGGSGQLYRVLFVIDIDNVENGLTVIYENLSKRTRHGHSARDWHRFMTKANQSTE